MVLRAVVVDLDGVLRRWDPRIIADAEARSGIAPGALAEAAFQADRLSAAVTGQLTDEQWRADIVAALAERFGSRAARAVAEWSASIGEVDEEVLTVVRRQRVRSRVALLSNATTRLPDDLARLGLADELDEAYTSAGLGVAKPDPRVYQLVCERLKLNPSDVAFVDDTVGHVVAAEAVGMVAHRYTSPIALAQFLDGFQWR